MSKAMKYLMDEHVYILKVVDKAEKVCSDLSQKDDSDEPNNVADLDKEFIRSFIDFIRNYADKFHHAKEEKILFIELEKPEVHMHCNPVEQMLIEHDEGRDFIAGIEKGLKEENVKKIVSNMTGYIGLIRDHIWKEDNILYKMADEALDKDALNKLYKEFEKVDFGRDVTKYIDFASE